MFCICFVAHLSGVVSFCAPALNFSTGFTLAGWFYASAFTGSDKTVLAAKDNATSDRECQLGVYSPNRLDYYFRAHVWVPSGLYHFAGPTRMQPAT